MSSSVCFAANPVDTDVINVRGSDWPVTDRSVDAAHCFDVQQQRVDDRLDGGHQVLLLTGHTPLLHRLVQTGQGSQYRV